MLVAITITCVTPVYVQGHAGLIGVITPDEDGLAQTVCIPVEVGTALALHAEEPYLLHACTQKPETEDW